MHTPPEGNEFYMTRRQIGEALGYVKADDAIQQIHDRNKDRLDPLSTTLTLGGVEGNRWVNRNTRVYTLRGVMEICRFSRQPNAEGVANHAPPFLGYWLTIHAPTYIKTS